MIQERKRAQFTHGCLTREKPANGCRVVYLKTLAVKEGDGCQKHLSFLFLMFNTMEQDFKNGELISVNICHTMMIPL